ncbi:MAG TPA: YfiR family protein [Verrucomicrobiae bacterium]|jgi:hypothetical protein
MANLKPVAELSRGGLALLMCVCWLAPMGRPLPAAQKSFDEYEVKAVFLFNFVQFVKWPAAAFDRTDSPIRIGVLGDDPFGAALDKTIKGESVGGRKLIVQRSRRPEDLNRCHLLFISASEKNRLPEILAGLKGGSVLTVSEIDQFAQRGGVINFFLEGNRVRFEINRDEAQRRGLEISAQLLKLGRVVNTVAQKEGG